MQKEVPCCRRTRRRRRRRRCSRRRCRGSRRCRRRPSNRRRGFAWEVGVEWTPHLPDSPSPETGRQRVGQQVGLGVWSRRPQLFAKRAVPCSPPSSKSAGSDHSRGLCEEGRRWVGLWRSLCFCFVETRCSHRRRLVNAPLALSPLVRPSRGRRSSTC